METDYYEARLKPQMEYYHKKCASLQKEYRRLSIAVITINALIPVLSISVTSGGAVQYIIALLSAVASVLMSVLLLNNTKEVWLEYRSTYEKLKREKILYDVSAEKYQDRSMQQLAVACEDIMASEHRQWKELYSGKK